MGVARDHMEKDEFSPALDRIHTALHACVKRLAQDAGIDVSAKKGLQEQYAEIRRAHPAFQVSQGEQVTTSILRGISKVIEGINQGRNEHSLAHPTEALLADPEARLFCNAGITILQYILDKVEEHESKVGSEEVGTFDNDGAVATSAIRPPAVPFGLSDERPAEQVGNMATGWDDSDALSVFQPLGSEFDAPETSELPFE